MGCRSIVRLRLSIIGVECGMWNVECERRVDNETRRWEGFEARKIGISSRVEAEAVCTSRRE
jgi:hypothetical protein